MVYRRRLAANLRHVHSPPVRWAVVLECCGRRHQRHLTVFEPLPRRMISVPTGERTHQLTGGPRPLPTRGRQRIRHERKRQPSSRARRCSAAPHGVPSAARLGACSEFRRDRYDERVVVTATGIAQQRD